MLQQSEVRSPKVSVIIPNYNHAIFLVARIESVLEQSYSDLEIILLDDYSSDDSLRIIKEYALRDERIIYRLNKRNSGSPFKQWNRGLQIARGEFIWIAESDDFANKEFLSILVKKLKMDDKLSMAFCQSDRVNYKGETLFSCNVWNQESRYENDFMNNGMDEFLNYGIFSHSIYNASAVVFRKSIAMQVPKYYTNFRYAGDALFWNEMLIRGNIYYCARVLNYFREHEPNQYKRGNDSLLTLEEYKILSYLKKKYRVSVSNRALNRKLDYLAAKILTMLKKREGKAALRIFKQGLKVDNLILYRIINQMAGRPFFEFIAK